MTIYYVRKNGGSDANAGTSFAAPFLTIGKGYSVLAASDTLRIVHDAGFTYFEGNLSRTVATVTVEGWTSSDTQPSNTVEAQWPLIDATGFLTGMQYYNSWTMKRLRVQDAQDSCIGSVSGSSRTLTLEFAEISGATGGNGHGITHFGDNSLIEHVTVHDCAGTGIVSASTLLDNAVVRACLVYDCNIGINLGTGTNNKIADCTVNSCTSTGITGNANVTAIDCISTNNATGYNATIVVDNCTAFGNTTNFAGSTDAESDVEDPQYVNAAAFDFHLQASTPAGTRIEGSAAGGGTNDLDGVAWESPRSRGAFQFVASAVLPVSVATFGGLAGVYSPPV